MYRYQPVDSLVIVGKQLERAGGASPVTHEIAHHCEHGQDIDPGSAHPVVCVGGDADVEASGSLCVCVDGISLGAEREREEGGTDLEKGI